MAATVEVVVATITGDTEGNIFDLMNYSRKKIRSAAARVYLSQ